MRSSGLNNRTRETQFLTKIPQHQRNHTREIDQKLETVNDERKTKTSHLVPPERT
ncbi:hypothetical protein CGK32_21740 [Vibrio parahaemolyticus]|nr:hypothetical protein CGK32_21740 [Vibrio parahaemolyticus]